MHYILVICVFWCGYDFTLGEIAIKFHADIKLIPIPVHFSWNSSEKAPKVTNQVIEKVNVHTVDIIATIFFSVKVVSGKLCC